MTADGPPLAGLRAALTGTPLAGAALAPLADTGLAHWHVRLVGQPWLARIPKQSQMGLDAAANLAYQAACFERAAVGGHAPALHAVLSPGPALPRGALLVEAIAGVPLQLPQDLPAMLAALAALHRLPLPAPATRAPLQDPADPLAALAGEIAAQGAHLATAALAPQAARRVADELGLWQRTLADPARPPKQLIAFDAHPGNYLRRSDGRVILVDLEKARYGAAALDLAHATLYTSTTWDPRSRAALSAAEVAAAYAGWAAAVPGGETQRRWFAPLRRAMWLWSLTWCAMWRVRSGHPPRAGGDGADWSAARHDAALSAHVAERVDHYLAADTIDRIGDEIAALGRGWAAS